MAATATTLKTGLEITAARRAVIKGFPHRWQSRPAATQTAVRSYSSACRTNPDVSRIARWNDLQPDVSQVCAGHGGLEAASHEPEHVESRNMRRGSVYATGCLMHRQRSRELPLLPPGALIGVVPHARRTGKGSRRGWRCTLGEQIKFPPLPCNRDPSSGDTLPDLPSDRCLPAGQPQRGPDRALPPGPSRSARSPGPVAVPQAGTTCPSAQRALLTAPSTMGSGWGGRRGAANPPSCRISGVCGAAT